MKRSKSFQQLMAERDPRGTRRMAYWEAKPIRCRECGGRGECVPQGNGTWTCDLCLHPAPREITMNEQPKPIRFAEEYEWAQRSKHELWDFGQADDPPSAARYINSLWEGAAASALDVDMRAVATAHDLDLKNYGQRQEAGRLLLADEPSWDHGVPFALKSERVQGAIETAYRAAKNAEQARAISRRSRGGNIDTRPDPSADDRQYAMREAATRLGVDLGTREGRDAALAEVARESPQLLPAYGRAAGFDRTDTAKLREHAERVEQAVFSERAAAEQPAPTPPRPPTGGYIF